MTNVQSKYSAHVITPKALFTQSLDDLSTKRRETAGPSSKDTLPDSWNSFTPVTMNTALRICATYDLHCPSIGTRWFHCDSLSTLARTLNLPRSHQNTHISGVAGFMKSSPLQTFASFSISTHNPPQGRPEHIRTVRTCVPFSVLHISVDQNVRVGTRCARGGRV